MRERLVKLGTDFIKSIKMVAPRQKGSDKACRPAEQLALSMYESINRKAA